MLNWIRYLPAIFLFFAFTTFAHGGFHGGYHHGRYHSDCYQGRYCHTRFHGDCYRSGCFRERCYPRPCFAAGSFCGIGLCLDDCCDYCDAPECEEVIVYRTVCGYEPCYGWRNGRYCCWKRYVCHRVPVRRRMVYY